MSEDALKSRRSAEVAMLTLAAATLVLSDESESKARLDRALRAIGEWPAESRLIREPLERAAPSPVFDLPAQPKLAWIDEHRSGGSVFVRGYSLVERCPALDNLCVALARCGPPARGGDADRERDRARCSSSEWRPIRIVDDRTPETALRLASTDLSAVARQLGNEPVARNNADQWARRLREAQEAFGVGSASARTAKASLSEARGRALNALKAVVDAEARAQSSVEILCKASDQARLADNQPGARSVLLASEAQASFIAVRVPEGPAGACRKAPCRAHDAGTNTTDAKDDLGPSGCIRATDVEIAPAGFAAGVHVVTAKRGSETSAGDADDPWRLGALTAAGVWAEIRDRDVASALAILKDKQSHAELEGELFGLKLHSTDAVRWAWLPILTLLAYALLGAGGAAEASATGAGAGAASQRWASWMWKIVVGTAAATAIGVSVHSALTLRPSFDALGTLALVGAGALIVLGAILRWASAARTRAPALSPHGKDGHEPGNPPGPPDGSG